MALQFVEKTCDEYVKVFHSTKDNFFAPYQSKKDFAAGVVKPILSTVTLYCGLKAALIIVGAVLGAAIYSAKGLVELAISDSISATESFSDSTILLKTTVALTVLTFLNPVVDVLSLLTRSGATLNLACKNNKETARTYTDELTNDGCKI